MSFLDDWKEWSTPKKVISILAVCCIGLIIIGMITGGGSPDKNTSPINDGNNNVEQITGKQVKIIYDGEWSGAAGDVSSINSISGSGDETIDMPDDASLISANAQKKDGSSNELTILFILGLNGYDIKLIINPNVILSSK